VTGSPQQSKVSDPSRLIFECRANRCSLREIQAGNGALGYYVPAPRRSKSDALELAEIVSVPLTRSQGN
jgi:hypothetical protein